MSRICSTVMFSSWPSTALVEGVKMGSGKRLPCCSPSGSWWPEIEPVAW